MDAPIWMRGGRRAPARELAGGIPLRMAWIAVAGLLGLFAALLVACETVPVTGRTQLNLLSEDEETKLGVEAYQQVLGKSKVSAAQVPNEMVRRVGSRIAAVTGKSYQWEYKLLDDPQANAFALPGGKIAVYTGILPIT